jgi:histidyl-tRNA synthetase
MSNKVSLPQGTRDFGPEVVNKRNYIFNTIQSVFELYGFQPLETPAMENLETLLGKYGEEGDKLIFKILNNGLDNPSKTEQAREDFEKILAGKNAKTITERALRYDLTIPFARFVALNHGQLTFPFKRYQLQPVWRADRPQKGRYREFYQCDADVVGSRSLLNEVELTNIYYDVFKKLGIDAEVRINNRKVLVALAELCGDAQKLTDITMAIDKLDKIGMNKVKEDLQQRGLTKKAIQIIEDYLNIKGTNQQKLEAFRQQAGNNKTAAEGVEEIEFVLNYPSVPAHNASPTLDFTLARGLNYYTGIIFEVRATGIQIGSIGGGGRYDDLTGLFGVPDIPGVGISFGVDRIYDVMEELKLFPEEVRHSTQVLFFHLGENESRAAFLLMQQLRGKQIRCELYQENVKFDKQFKYAIKKRIPYVVIIGNTELESKTCNLKNLQSGHQETLSFDELLSFNFSEL